jgi:hypothetical protein
MRPVHEVADEIIRRLARAAASAAERIVAADVARHA